MKLNAIGHNVATNSIHFGNQLSTQQAEMKAELEAKIDKFEGKKKTDYNIVKLYHQAFPSDPGADIGIGYMNSNTADKIYNKIKVQTNANVIKFMPIGELTDNGDSQKKGRTAAYERSGLSIGADMINIPDLVTEKWGEILPQYVLDKLIEQHKQNGSEDRIDFATTLGNKNQEDYPINEALGIAFNNFLNMPHPNEELVQLRQEFKEFKKDPLYDDLFSRTALYHNLKDWGTGRIENIKIKDLKDLKGLEDLDNFREIEDAFKRGDKEFVVYQGNIFNGMDSENPSDLQKLLYNKVKETYKKDINFYKFKQFLASKNVDEGVELVHKNGMLAFGDAAFGFSWPEVQTFPDAFKWVDKDRREVASIGMGLPAINLELLHTDQTQKSAAHKVLAAKQELLLRHFDGVREDMGWLYIKPWYANCQVTWEDGSHETGAADTVPKFIEYVAKTVKGDSFDTGRILYECDTNGELNLYDPQTQRVLNSIGGKAILSTHFEHQRDAKGWGGFAALTESFGLKKFVLQCGNHDGRQLLELVNLKDMVSDQVGALLRSLRLPGDQWWKLKDDNNFFSNVHKFIRAKFAEIRLSPTNAMLINDAFGREERIDLHGSDESRDYKMRWSQNWEQEYDAQVTQNKAFNWGDVTNFKAECTGKKNENHELYEMAEKFAAYEQRNDGIHTQEQADNSEYGKLDIASMSLEEIRNLNLSA